MPSRVICPREGLRARSVSPGRILTHPEKQGCNDEPTLVSETALPFVTFLAVMLALSV